MPSIHHKPFMSTESYSPASSRRTASTGTTITAPHSLHRILSALATSGDPTNMGITLIKNVFHTFTIRLISKPILGFFPLLVIYLIVLIEYSNVHHGIQPQPCSQHA